MGELRDDDALLVARLCASDDRALGAVYDRFAPMVFGVSRRVTGDPQMAREITQEVFVHLWARPDRVDLSRGTLRSYLAMLAHRRAVDEVRRSVRRGRAEARASGRDELRQEGHETEVVEAIARAEEGARLASLLDHLPTDQRVALELAYFEGNTFREVARLLQIPEGTAKSRLRLALARLRALMGDERRGER